MPQKEFKHFEHVYIGDVDFLIVKEKPSLLEAHLNHCNKIGLPYSNKIRPNTRRMTGLHFYKTKEYYEKLSSTIDFYLSHPHKLEKKILEYGRNEIFLYELLKEKFGIGKIKKYPFRPHHGFHLGILRNRNHSKKFNDYINRNRSLHYSELKNLLLSYYEDPIFKKIMNQLPIKEVTLLYKYLHK
ncbi:hypothetical protein [Evansella tamaricis]|uniref:Uncharacterized protein n=1 Tax=Evansella tamaricis TaxID=2069301 RepID=A0ABS6JI05_9BACI|nr:hypothetical protein [Evansella tamaricis]MBU9713314.1 hypothetical protein [Evansella tamaricis]